MHICFQKWKEHCYFIGLFWWFYSVFTFWQMCAFFMEIQLLKYVYSLKVIIIVILWWTSKILNADLSWQYLSFYYLPLNIQIHIYVCVCVGTIENIPFHITKVTPYRFSTLSPSPLYYPSYLSYKYYAALSLLCTCDPSFSCWRSWRLLRLTTLFYNNNNILVLAI